MNIIDIWVNCPSREVAEKIAAVLLQKRLIACANIFASIDSAYHWQGNMERDTEIPLLLKSKAVLFAEIAAEIQRMHPYEIPPITGVPVTQVNAAYKDWVISETK